MIYLICVYNNVHVCVYVDIMYFLRTDIHSICFCIYIYTQATPLTTKINVNFCWTFHLTAPQALCHDREMASIAVDAAERSFYSWSFFSRHLDFRVLTSQRNSNFMFLFWESQHFSIFFWGPVLWGLQFIDSIAKIYLKKEPPPKKRGLGPYKPMYMGGNINFPRTWYIDWMML